jgi:hypothetical protein
LEYALFEQRDGLKRKRPMGKRQKTFKPGQGYTMEDWDAVQSPELTDEQMAEAKPFAEIFPNSQPRSAEDAIRTRHPIKVD